MWRHLSSLTGKFAKDYPTLYRNRFQASPGNSDSADWPGYEVALHPLNSRHPVIKSKFCACAVTGLCFFSSLSLKLFKKNTRFREDKALSSLVVVNKHKFVHDRSTYETWLRKLMYFISGQQVKRWGISSKLFAWFLRRNLVGLCYHDNGRVSASSFSILIPYHLLFQGKRMREKFF